MSSVRRVERRPSERPVVITGGAGFIGANLAHRLLRDGRRVRLVDNLSRPGVEQNLAWLRDRHRERLEHVAVDVRSAVDLRRAVSGASAVFHLAAQVAVTTSVADPVADFEVNARGTLNLLEAIRREPTPPPLVFTSTNKVYGALDDLDLEVRDRRWEPADEGVRRRGIGGDRRLDFHSPYGCSKGAADQYVLDYARIYDLPAVVFRMSCIYGPLQRGNEDQGWVAHFLLRALEGRPVTLFGDGMQVRDLLYVEDLLDALLLASERAGDLAGRAFNIGGGPERSVSLLQVLELIGDLEGRRPRVLTGPWRPGDQRYYVSDTRDFGEAAGWRPRTPVSRGIAKLHRWMAGEPAAPRALRPLAEGSVA